MIWPFAFFTRHRRPMKYQKRERATTLFFANSFMR